MRSRRGLGRVALFAALAFACTPSGQAQSSGAGATIGTSATGGSAGTSTSPIEPNTTQLVTVISADWSSVPATLQRYEAAQANDAWTPVGVAIPVVIGKSGLGWGI